MTSQFDDLSRPPLSESDLRSSLLRAGHLWSSVSVVRQTGSTNADLRQAVEAGAGHGTVLIAEEQVAGRGRLDRSWTAPARSSLTFSMLLRPLLNPAQGVRRTLDSPPAPWGWLPLTAAISVCEVLEQFDVENVALKWPNDVLIQNKKVAGILAELHASVVILGIGLNVSQETSELATAQATSLLLAGATTDRSVIVRAILRAFEANYQTWSEGEVDVLRERYLERTLTVGTTVTVVLPGGKEIHGHATDIDALGRLVVMDGSTRHAVAAADVTHATLAT